MSYADVSTLCVGSGSPYCSFWQSRWDASAVYVFRFINVPTLLKNTTDALALVKAYGRVLTDTIGAPNHEVRGIIFKAFDRPSTQQWINGFPSQVEIVITVPESESIFAVKLPEDIVAKMMNDYLLKAGAGPTVSQAAYLQIVPDAAANYWKSMSPIWRRKLAKECLASGSCAPDVAGITDAGTRGEGVHFGSASPASAVTGHMPPTPQPELGPPSGALSLPGMFSLGKTGLSTPLMAAGLLGAAGLFYLAYGGKKR